MRHRWSGKKLGRTSKHRNAMTRNMVTSLIDEERVRTTLAKAKEVRRHAERIITLGKRGTLHARRRAAVFLKTPASVQKLMDTIGPRYAERPGGYTRIIKLGPRRGDNAEMALIELVDAEIAEAAEEPKASKKKTKKAEADSDHGDEADEAKAEAAPTKKVTKKRATKKKVTKKKTAKSAGGKASKTSKTAGSAKKKTAKKAGANRKTGK